MDVIHAAILLRTHFISHKTTEASVIDTMTPAARIQTSPTEIWSSTIEIVLPDRTITLSEYTVNGFDFQVNDDQDSDAKDCISKWNDPANDSSQSTSGYGVLTLK